MIHSIEVQVDQESYSFTHYPATKSVELLAELFQLSGKSIASLIGSGGLDSNMDAALIGSVIGSLAENMGKSSVSDLIKRLLATTKVKKEMGYADIGQVFDIHFAGRAGHMFKVLWACLKFQYGDFSDALGGLAAVLPSQGQG